MEYEENGEYREEEGISGNKKMNENWNSKTGNIGNLGGKWEIGKTIEIGKTGTFCGKREIRKCIENWNNTWKVGKISK